MMKNKATVIIIISSLTILLCIIYYGGAALSTIGHFKKSAASTPMRLIFNALSYVYTITSFNVLFGTCTLPFSSK